MNSLKIMGRLTRDPELKYAQSGTAICKCGIAVDSYAGKDKEPATCFVDVVVFGKRGEAFHKCFQKGKPVLVEGRLDFQQWEDKNGGGKRSKHQMVVEQWSFLLSDSTQGSEGAGGSVDEDIPF